MYCVRLSSEIALQGPVVRKSIKFSPGLGETLN